ncbi:MAG: hybrid sensor histidine kinase/response regulator transcription factor, partial [Cyclobacteriaceae bacterium]
PIAYQNDGQYILLESKPIEGKRIRFSAIKHTKHSYSVRRLYDESFRSTTENHLFWDNQDQLWIGGEMITKYDLNVNYNFERPFKTYVRKVTVGQDSIIFGGHQSARIKPVLDYSNGGLRFEFASPSLLDPQANRYQYRLRGFDETWSDWTVETKKDYTNLPAGNYQFLARAQNAYGKVSSAGTFTFEILAPWYNSTWAHVCYLLLAALFVFGIVHLRSAQLKRDKRKLEALVDEKISEIKRQAEKLKELDKVKSRFFANISHEFRTPLTLILGPLVDRLNKKLIPADRQEFEVMRRNAQRLQRLINQLLDLSKIESRSLKLQVSKGDIHFFLRAILSSFSSYAKQRNIQYEMLIPEQELQGYFDDDKLEKIIYNLVSNAFKFTADGGEITVSSQWRSDLLKIEVTDNGCGIPAHKLNAVFNRFYQTDDSPTRTHEGTGIGLALTKELVSLHKGTVTVKSTPGQGSTFTITLPLKASAYKDQKISKEAIPRHSLHVSRQIHNEIETPPIDRITEATDAPIVLVVEDHAELRHYIKSHLSNYRVLEAANGSEGLTVAIKQVPDLVISDVMMPKMNGVDLLHSLKTNEKTSHIPVILLTAKADLPSKLEGFETGADDYLTKPFDAKELLARCQNIIEQRKLLRNKFSSTLVLKPKDIAITPTDEVFLNKVMETVEKHLEDSSFSVEVFQQEVGMSRMQLHRKLKALTDYSTTEFIRVQRLKRAAQLLADTDATISDICYRVGFNSLSYFTKCFKEQYGKTPSDFAFSNQT